MINMQLWLIGKTNQINLQDPAQSYYLQPDIEGLTGLPSIRTSEGLNVGGDGGWTGPQNYDPRFIAIPVMITNQYVAIVEKRRRDLITLLAEKRLLLKYISEAGDTYSTKVVVMGAPSPLRKLLTRVDMKINLKADDPLMYDFVSETGLVARLNVRNPASGFTFNFAIPLNIPGGDESTIVENTGTSTVKPIITVYGPISQPTIVNQTTSQQMQVLADLTTYDELIIDTALETITINGVDKYHLKSDESEFIEIAAGENNMYLTSAVGDQGGYAEVNYNSGYIGI